MSSVNRAFSVFAPRAGVGSTFVFAPHPVTPSQKRKGLDSLGEPRPVASEMLWRGSARKPKLGLSFARRSRYYRGSDPSNNPRG